MTDGKRLKEASVRSKVVNRIRRSPSMIVVILSLLIACWVFLQAREIFESVLGGGSTINVSSNALQVYRAEKVRDIVAMRVHVADILEFAGDDHEGSWLVFGDALVTVDAASVEVETDHVARVIRIRAPHPVVKQPRIDENLTRPWELKGRHWWTSSDGLDWLDERSRLHAQRVIARQVEAGPYVEQAKERAALILRRLYQEPAYESDLVWMDSDEIDP